MAEFPVERTLLREPRLWVPGKKPIGPVKIDWSNPLTENLQSFILTGNNVELVSQKSAVMSGDIVRAVSNGQLCTKCTNGPSSDGKLIGNEVNAGNQIQVTLSVLVEILDDAEQYRYACGYRDDANAHAVGITPRHSGNYWGLFYRDTVKSDTSARIDQTHGMHHLTAVNIASNECKLYRDGKLRHISTTNQTSTIANPSEFVANNNSSNVSISNGDDDVVVHYAAIWKRALPEEQVLAMQSNPYQFLIPA